MINKLKSLIKNEDGQTLVLVALLFSVLLGFAALSIDYGYLSLQKRKLQNAADAAALAGIVEVSKGNINNNDPALTGIVYNIANLNASELVATDIVHNIENSGKNLKVDIKHQYNNFFANAIGIKTSVVSASATATWEGSSEDNFDADVLPLAILKTDYNNYMSRDPNKDYGYLGFIGNVRSGFYNEGMHQNDRGYFTQLKKGEIEKLEEDFVEKLFKGDSKQKLIVNTNDIVYSVRTLYDDKPEDGIKARIKRALKVNDKASRKNIMTAVIPVVTLVCEKNKDGSCVKDRFGKDVPLKTDEKLKKDSSGEHYQFKVEHFTTIIIWDVLQNNGNLFGLDENFDSNFNKKGQSLSWRTLLRFGIFDWFPSDTRKGIVVSFISESTDSNNGKLTYKLIK